MLHPSKFVLVIPQSSHWLAIRKGKILLAPSPKGDWDSFIINYNRARFINKGDVVIEAGACIGATAISISHKADKVIAIEPDPLNFVFLRENIKLHRCENIILINKALWSSKREIKMYVASTFTGHSLMRPIALSKPFSGKIIKVEADTLDNIVAELNIKKVDVLLMNIEGAEMEALKGAEETLKKVKRISIDCHSRELKDKVINFLRARGFTVQVEGSDVHAERRDVKG